MLQAQQLVRVEPRPRLAPGWERGCCVRIPESEEPGNMKTHISSESQDNTGQLRLLSTATAVAMSGWAGPTLEDTLASFCSAHVTWACLCFPGQAAPVPSHCLTDPRPLCHLPHKPDAPPLHAWVPRACMLSPPGRGRCQRPPGCGYNPVEGAG